MSVTQFGINFNLVVNKYDFILVVLAVCTCFGNFGGAFQVDRILAMLFLPLLIKLLSNKGYDYARHNLKWIIVIYVYMLISFLWTPDKTEAVKELVYYPVHFILFLELLVFSRKAENPLRCLSRGWMIAVLLCSVVAYWEITTGNHLSMSLVQRDFLNTGSVIIQHQTASVTFYNYNSYVTFLCFSIPWLFYIMIDKKRSITEQIISGAALAMASLAIIINASRGGVLAIGVMLFVYYWYSEKSNIKNILLVIIIGITVYCLTKYGNSITEVLVAKSSDGALFSDDARSNIWSHALMAFAESFGFGVGIGGLSAAMGKFAHGGIVVTHNMFLEVLVQYGIIIGFIVIIFLLRLLKKSLKVERSRKNVLLMALISMPLYTIIDSNYLLNVHLYVLIATIYIYVNYELIKYPNRIL